MDNFLENKDSLINVDEKRLKDIAYVCYLESLSFDSLRKSDVNLISNTYLHLLKKSDKLLKKKLPTLSLYNYHSEANNNFAPIQPHDSEINSIKNKNNNIEISGFGNSFKNYEIYDFSLKFENTDNAKIEKYIYENGSVISTTVLKEIDDRDLKDFIYRDIFFEETNTLKNEVTLIFIKNENDEDESDDFYEKREIFYINFDFEKVLLKMEIKDKKNICKLR